ncbi:MAG: hypothetical protein L6Q98_25275, partial [Anaerolineae bacterium]|nr:hypothetical protein [Anaerolineae bacterium]
DTTGPGNFGGKAEALDSYVNPVVRGNRVYTDAPSVAFNGWTLLHATLNKGLAAWDTVILPLADYPAARREIDIPEKGAKLVFAYDVAGAAAPAGAKVLYPPPNPIGWSGSAPSITPVRAEIAVWREEGGEDVARIAELEAALKLAEARIGKIEAEKNALALAHATLAEQAVRDAPLLSAARALWAASLAFGEAATSAPPHPPTPSPCGEGE